MFPSISLFFFLLSHSCPLVTIHTCFHANQPQLSPLSPLRTVYLYTWFALPLQSISLCISLPVPSELFVISAILLFLCSWQHSLHVYFIFVCLVSYCHTSYFYSFQQAAVWVLEVFWVVACLLAAFFFISLSVCYHFIISPSNQLLNYWVTCWKMLG